MAHKLLTKNAVKLVYTGVAVGVAVSLAVGCGTVQQTYKPSKLGFIADHQPYEGIEVTLVPDKYRARIGDPVSFVITIKNVSNAPILFPEDPDVLLTWVYPDGKRDNLIRPERTEAPKYRILRPGETFVANAVVTTYYFDHSGIHEFRAILRNTPVAVSSTGRPPWQGRAVSNAFGILMEAN